MARPRGQPKIGGRQKGTPNKATADIRALAQRYGQDALDVLHDIMTDKQRPAAARVAAAKEMLDRGYGKSPQPIAMQGVDMAKVFSELMERMPA